MLEDEKNVTIIHAGDKPYLVPHYRVVMLNYLVRFTLHTFQCD
jgi:hypothetical protein